MKKRNDLSTSGFLKLLFGFFTLAFLVTAVILPDRGQMFDGLWRIISQTAKVSTNYFDYGGYAGAFLNAALVCLICTALYFLPGAKATGTSVIAFLLTAGFTFWGINVLNIWFGFLGCFCTVWSRASAPALRSMPCSSPAALRP